MFKRALSSVTIGKRSFFLWGQRKSGKTTLLRELYPSAFWIDLLQSDQFRLFAARPERLREVTAVVPLPEMVVIDEVQKAPGLLDEVHWLIENRKIQFALSGSSARKLKRGHANLLGGRALRFELYGLCSHELGSELDLTRLLNTGYLPDHYLSGGDRRLLESYVADYLKEEIAAESLVKNLTPFSDFLTQAALSDAEKVNFSTFARDCGVSSHTTKEYFQILCDTLLGFWLPAYTKRPKRKVVHAPKFFFSDVGVVNVLAKRWSLEPGSASFGKAFENFIAHELRCYNQYRGLFFELSYWGLSGGGEVDFILGEMAIAIEAKASSRITSDHLAGLRQLEKDHPKRCRKIIVCLEPQPRKTDDGIEILPYQRFLRELWEGGII